MASSMSRPLGGLTRLLGASSAVRSITVSIAVVAVGILAVVAADDFTVGQVALLAAYVCAALGLTVLIGVSGQISLGHAALMAVGAYTMAKFLGPRATELQESTLPVVATGLLLAVGVALLVGGVVGVAAARLQGPYLAGATLALGVALPGVTAYFHDTFNGEQGLPIPSPDVPAQLEAALWLPDRFVALIGVLAAGLTLFLALNLKKSAAGRHMAAVRDNEVAAQLCGLSIQGQKVTAFAFSAATAGLGGAILGLFLQGANPHSFGLVLSLGLLAVVVVGGLGSLRGALWGSVAIVLLQKYLSGLEVDDNLPAAAYGLLLIIVILAAPRGIQGLVSHVGSRLPHLRTNNQGAMS